MAKKDNYNLYLTAIVACVAIIALVILTTNTGETSFELGTTDLTGQAYGGGPSCTDPDGNTNYEFEQPTSISGINDDGTFTREDKCYIDISSSDQLIQSFLNSECTSGDPANCLVEQYCSGKSPRCINGACSNCPETADVGTGGDVTPPDTPGETGSTLTTTPVAAAQAIGDFNP